MREPGIIARKLRETDAVTLIGLCTEEAFIQINVIPVVNTGHAFRSRRTLATAFCYLVNVVLIDDRQMFYHDLDDDIYGLDDV